MVFISLVFNFNMISLHSLNIAASESV